MTSLNSKFKYEITYISTEPLDATSIKRRLSYPIKHNQEAYYTTRISDTLPEKETNKSILRRLVIKVDKSIEKQGQSKKPKLKIEELDKKLEEILEEEVTK
ncbi:MAG: hypothetical protein ABIG90_01795 [bacterium]